MGQIGFSSPRFEKLDKFMKKPSINLDDIKKKLVEERAYSETNNSVTTDVESYINLDTISGKKGFSSYKKKENHLSKDGVKKINIGNKSCKKIIRSSLCLLIFRQVYRSKKHKRRIHRDMGTRLIQIFNQWR